MTDLTTADLRFLAMVLRRHYFPSATEQRQALDLLDKLERAGGPVPVVRPRAEA